MSIGVMIRVIKLFTTRRIGYPVFVSASLAIVCLLAGNWLVALAAIAGISCWTVYQLNLSR